MDIRPQLYDRYVSSFKQENAALTPQELEHYYEWCDARYYPYLEQLSRSASILELGCGHGRILHYLRQKGFSNARGIDISQEQVDLARRDGLDAEGADVFEYLEKQTTPGDCIIAIDFVEHFTKDELLRLFELIHDSLALHGMLLIQTVNGEGLFPRQIIYGDLTHQTILSPGSMAQLLRMSGFHRFEFAECAPISRGVRGIVRSFVWRMVRLGANIIRLVEAGKTQALWTENFITVVQL